jgi:hypothetical protein
MFAKIAQLSKGPDHGRPLHSWAGQPCERDAAMPHDGFEPPFWALESLIRQGYRLDVALAILASQRDASSATAIGVAASRLEADLSEVRISA